jgi:hypothetical protein
MSANVNKEPTREQCIDMEIVMDAYSAPEQAVGWYYYCVARNRLAKVR